jgi:hypothetical protein
VVVAAALPATVAVGLRHLESQRSLLALGKDSPGLSALAKKMRLAPDHHVAMAFVKIDDNWTALRFKKT